MLLYPCVWTASTRQDEVSPLTLAGSSCLCESLASSSQGCAHPPLVTVVTGKSHETCRKVAGLRPGLHAASYAVLLGFSH